MYIRKAMLFAELQDLDLDSVEPLMTMTSTVQTQTAVRKN